MIFANNEYGKELIIHFSIARKCKYGLGRVPNSSVYD